MNRIKPNLRELGVKRKTLYHHLHECVLLGMDYDGKDANERVICETASAALARLSRWIDKEDKNELFMCFLREVKLLIGVGRVLRA